MHHKSVLNVLNYSSKFLIFFLVIIACNKKKLTMPELLKKAAEEQFFVPENIYAASIRAAYFDSISATVPANKRDSYNIKKAESLLYAGKTKEAIEILEPLIDYTLFIWFKITSPFGSHIVNSKVLKLSPSTFTIFVAVESTFIPWSWYV